MIVDNLLFVIILQPLQIKSAVAKEGLRGYIYIEAYKQTHVKQAIEGIGNLRMGYYKQQVIKIMLVHEKHLSCHHKYWIKCVTIM